MNALVVGYGSIGKRHARLLTQLGCNVAVLSSQNIVEYPCYSELSAALQETQPGYIVVSNATNDHHSMLSEMVDLGFSGKVLVEKPLFQKKVDFDWAIFENIYVGYNLRFHPVVQKLHSLLKGEVLLSVQAYVGQYLPDWRPDTDYRSSYSASKSMGGGVLRDLSHELDLLTWLFGDWSRLVALKGHYSHLEIETEDTAAIMMATSRCPMITLQMNYLDRTGNRDLIINTEAHTIKADLINGTLCVDNELERLVAERDQTYIAQHNAVLNNVIANLCHASEGSAVLDIIEAIEDSANRLEWVVK